jgi:drug/metabolite transporter (DMT)-like permease
MKLERHGSLRADLSLVGISAIWGFTFTAMQLALRDASPLSFVAARFALASLALALIFRGRALRVTGPGLKYGILLGLCLASGSVLQTTGLVYTTASKSAFITALYVIIVPLICLLVTRVRPRLSSLVAVLIAAVGLAEITAVQIHGFSFGDLLTLGCAVAFALHIVVAEIAAPDQDPVLLTFWQALTTAVASSLVMLVAERPHLPLTSWTVVALVVTSLFATALAFSVQMWAQKETSGTHTALIFAAEPVFAAVFSVLIQHERLGIHGLIGGGLILGAILVSEIGARRG